MRTIWKGHSRERIHIVNRSLNQLLEVTIQVLMADQCHFYFYFIACLPSTVCSFSAICFALPIFSSPLYPLFVCDREIKSWGQA